VRNLYRYAIAPDLAFCFRVALDVALVIYTVSQP
jgi:hypothetical protein